MTSSTTDAKPLDRLLTQNSELRRNGIWNWTLPAFVVKLSDGTRFNTCPHAGSCARVCYARFGTYRFSNVRDRHMRNLEYLLGDGDNWEAQMTREVAHTRFNPSGKPHTLPFDECDPFVARWAATGGKAIRIHDAGDFFSAEYLARWVRIALSRPHVLFYAYTKEISLLLDTELPDNFRIIFSYGGTEDHLINRDTHRHADVFPTEQELDANGYFNQEDNDILAAIAPTTRIGIVMNNIPATFKKFAGKPMSRMLDRNTDNENPPELHL